MEVKSKKKSNKAFSDSVFFFSTTTLLDNVLDFSQSDSTINLNTAKVPRCYDFLSKCNRPSKN